MDHEELFSMVNSFAGDFLMTYDDDERIRALAAEYGLETALVTMRSTHHVEMTELLIGRDLSWLRVS
jgi:DNA adenine methylase